AAKLKGEFPHCLNDAPFLVPTSASNIRRALQRWFDDHELRPNIVGEFDDSALVKAFGQAGVGVFTAPTAIEAYVTEQFNVKYLGRTNDIKESFYAISAERKVKHPALLAIREAAKKSLIGG
ncbi:MAG TPA: LysR substrate-binding domain-containing protein, partial [Pseudomonadales bacterium]|nr:LysR substrate-binding domain-containing protein [Pseudomonadales bacterium]